MRKKITIRNTFFSIMVQFATIISGFIIPRLLLSTFGSEVNGLVSSLNQLLNYITLIEGGLTGVILANLYKPLSEKNEEKINGIVSATYNFFKKIAYLFLVYTILLSLIYPLIVKSDFSFGYICSLTLILSVNLFMQYFFSLTWKILLQADKKVYFTSMIQIICIILNTLGVYIAVHVCPNIHLVKLLSSLVFVIQPIAFDLYVKKHYNIDKHFEPDKKALSQRWDGFGINIAAFIHNNTDMVVLTFFTTLKTVSIYSVYLLVVNGLKNLISSISVGIVPTIGHIYASEDKEKLNNMFDLYEIVIYFSSFVLFVIGGLTITPFVQIFTKNVVDANYYQPLFGWILISAELVFCLREPYVNMAYSANKFKDISKYCYIEAILNIVISVALVINFGLIGVAIGTLISMLFRTIFHVVYLRKNILERKIIVATKNFFIFVVGAIISIFIATRLFDFTDVSVISWIIFAIKNSVIVLMVYAIIFIIFYRKKVIFLIKNRKN